MIIKDWKKEILTIPNLLSLFRLLLIPVYVVIYVNAKDASGYYLSAAILAISCLTDMIDGKIARHFDMVTAIGKILDPLADKATQFTMIICLSIKHPVIHSLIVLFVIKEGFQLIAGSINLKHGKMLKGALLSGKICTTVLFVSLIIMVMLPDLTSKIITIITVIDLIFMLVAFLDYIITYANKSSRFQYIDETP